MSSKQQLKDYGKRQKSELARLKSENSKLNSEINLLRREKIHLVKDLDNPEPVKLKKRLYIIIGMLIGFAIAESLNFIFKHL